MNIENVLYSKLYLHYDIQRHQVQPRRMAIPVTSLRKTVIFLNSQIVQLLFLAEFYLFIYNLNRKFEFDLNDILIKVRLDSVSTVFAFDTVNHLELFKQLVRLRRTVELRYHRLYHNHYLTWCSFYRI